MATESELKAAKFVLPADDDEVKNGDDAIRANAKAAYEHAENIATLKAAGAIALTRIQPQPGGVAVDGYGTQVGMLSDAIPGAWFVNYLRRLVVVGDTAPAETSIDSFPVLWVDTRDRAAWKATPAVIDDRNKTVTIPDDEGATYTLNGEEIAPGAYSKPNPGSPIEYVITAYPKTGYTLTGTRTWRGYITAGWEDLGVDTLTTGSWDNARAAFGTTWSNTSKSDGTTLDSRGLRVPEHDGRISGVLKFDFRRVAQRISVDYDLSVTEVPGSRPIVQIGIGMKSDKYGESSQLFNIGVRKYGSAASLITMATGLDTYTAEGTLSGHPITGTLTIEAMGSNATVSINGQEVATYTAPGTVTAYSAGLQAVGSVGIVKNFRYAVK